MKFISVIYLLVSLCQVHGKFAYFQRDLQKTSYYQCIKPTSNGRVTVYLIYTDDLISPFDVKNIQHAYDAGLAVEVAIAPVRCRGVEEELAFLVENLKIGTIDKFWVVLEKDAPTCTWKNYSPEQNCQYLQNLITKAA